MVLEEALLKIKTILEETKDAFKNVQYPRYDYYNAVADMEYLELSDIKCNTNQKKYWNKIKRNEFIKYREFIFFINDKESIYYFPTYITYIIENKDSFDYGIDSTFFYKLYNINLSILSMNQLLVLLKFLKYCNIKYEKEEDCYEKTQLEEVFNKIYLFSINLKQNK